MINSITDRLFYSGEAYAAISPSTLFLNLVSIAEPKALSIFLSVIGLLALAYSSKISFALLDYPVFKKAKASIISILSFVRSFMWALPSYC